VEPPGFVGFTYRDERYHVPFDLDAGQGRWRIDLSLWLRDLHGHVADWHTRHGARLPIHGLDLFSI
jgi:hypothetical protein